MTFYYLAKIFLIFNFSKLSFLLNSFFFNNTYLKIFIANNNIKLL